MKIFSNKIGYFLVVAVIAVAQFLPNFAIADTAPLMSLDQIKAEADSILSKLQILQAEINILNNGEIYTVADFGLNSPVSTSCDSFNEASSIEKCASDFENVSVAGNENSTDDSLKNMASVLSAVGEILSKIMSLGR
jgi:hypothetical protein